MSLHQSSVKSKKFTHFLLCTINEVQFFGCYISFYFTHIAFGLLEFGLEVLLSNYFYTYQPNRIQLNLITVLLWLNILSFSTPSFPFWTCYSCFLQGETSIENIQISPFAILSAI